jgi:hypothetical protein
MSLWTALHWRKNWEIRIVSRYTGTRARLPLPHLRFRTYEQAAAWCVDTNAHYGTDDPYFEPVPIVR